MRRVYVIVEGPTEESFVQNAIAPIFWTRQTYVIPILIGKPGHKGGRTNYARVKRDVLVTLKQHRTAYCSMMVDLYGLGEGFPGTPLPPNATNMEKVHTIEQAVKEDIQEAIPDFRPDVRFLPYIQLHEYEGLLFSDAATFATAIKHPELTNGFQQIRNDFDTPEDINDGPLTAPSKRILDVLPSYKKVIEGTIAAQKIGVDKMRQECPHFREWIGRLETLEDLEQWF